MSKPRLKRTTFSGHVSIHLLAPCRELANRRLRLYSDHVFLRLDFHLNMSTEEMMITAKIIGVVLAVIIPSKKRT